MRIDYQSKYCVLIELERYLMTKWNLKLRVVGELVTAEGAEYTELGV
jgi:hypothetical protein